MKKKYSLLYRLTGVTAICAAMCSGLRGQAPAPLPGQMDSRSYYLGFTPFPPTYEAYGYDLSYTFLKDHGDLVSLSYQDGIPWVEAARSSDVKTFPDAVQETWRLAARRQAQYIPKHSIYLSINTINLDFLGLAPYWGTATNQPLPGPWRYYDFNHPEVKRAALNYCVAAIKYFNPKYFAVAVEANILLARAPDRWWQFKELNQYLYTQLKALYPDLIVFPTIHFEHMMGRLAWSAQFAKSFASFYPDVLQVEVRDLLKNSDMLALSSYPYSTTDNAVTEDYYDVAVKIAADLAIPLAIEQTGYITQNVEIPNTATLSGSERLQSDFFKYLFRFADKNKLRFVVNFVPMDYGYNYGMDLLAMAWSWTGLTFTDGTPKEALALWDAQLKKDYVPPPRIPRLTQ